MIAELAERYPSAPRLLLDSGNFTGRSALADDPRTRVVLSAMERLGYRVVNVGDRDVRTGYDLFRSRVGDAPFRFLSANLVREEDRRPVFEPHTVVELEGDPRLRVGVVGAVRYNPIFRESGPDGTHMVIEHPRDRVRREVEALREKKVDLIVLLAAMHQNDATELAAEVEGIDYVLGSFGGRYTIGEERVGETRLLYTGNRGQRIGEVQLFADEKGGLTGPPGRLHHLTLHYPNDPDMLALVERMKAEYRASEEADGESAP